MRNAVKSTEERRWIGAGSTGERRVRARQRLVAARPRLLGGIALFLLAACSTGPSGSPDASLGGAPSDRPAGASSGANLASNAAPSSEPAPTDEPSHPPGASPVEVVQAFYDWYLEGRPMTEVVARPELSPALIEFLLEFDQPHDPFACSEVLPASIQAVSSSLSGKTAIVSTIVLPDGVTEQPGPPVDLVVSTTGEWQLEFVGCGGG
jgi:hypothetical protein